MLELVLWTVTPVSWALPWQYGVTTIGSTSRCPTGASSPLRSPRSPGSRPRLPGSAPRRSSRRSERPSTGQGSTRTSVSTSCSACQKSSLRASPVSRSTRACRLRLKGAGDPGYEDPDRDRLRRPPAPGRLLGRGPPLPDPGAARRFRELGRLGARRRHPRGTVERRQRRGGSRRHRAARLPPARAGGEGGQESPAPRPQRGRRSLGRARRAAGARGRRGGPAQGARRDRRARRDGAARRVLGAHERPGGQRVLRPVAAGRGRARQLGHASGHVALPPPGPPGGRRFDADELFDYRARRPTLEILDGKPASLTWPELTVRRAHGGDGRDVLVLAGPEPDYRWRELADAAVELGRRFGVVEWISLGAIPAAVPHTRPVPILGTSSRPGLLRGDVQPGPAGMLRVPSAAISVLDLAVASAGIAAIGYYAQVPHYVAGPYPAAAIELLRAVGRHIGREPALGSLPAEARELAARLA